MACRRTIHVAGLAAALVMIGLLAVNILKPGVGLVLPASTGAAPIAGAPQTWDQILLHTVPNSVIEAMAQGDDVMDFLL